MVLKNIFSKKIMVLVLCMGFAFTSFSQEPCNPGGDPDTDPNIPCPIDGGLSLLIAAGIGIGAKKAYGERKKKQTAQF